MSVSYDSVTLLQHAQCKDPEIEAAEWKPSLALLLTPAFPTVTCQNVFSGKGPLYSDKYKTCLTTLRTEQLW